MKMISRSTGRRWPGFLLAMGAVWVVGTANASNLPDAGMLTLRLGSIDQFEFAPPGSPSPTVTQAIVDRRSITNDPKDACILNRPASPPLVELSAGGGVPGFNFDSIGVFGGGNGPSARGVACSRVGSGQSLTLALAGQLANFAVKRASLDIEVKMNARILAVTNFSGTTRRYELRSGSSIGLPVPPDTVVTNCAAQSDSGPDSGGNDNCRWVIEGLWKSGTFSTLVGEWSLEGGSDSSTQPSTFELVEASGNLNCGDTVTVAGPNQASVDLTRLQNVVVSQCVAVPYVLVFRSGTDLEFFKDDLGQVVATAITITWPNEAAPTTAPVLNNIPLTQQEFLEGEIHPLDLCVGTPVYVGGVFQSLTGPFPDLSGADGLQYGCVLRRDVTYPASDTIGLKETIYLEGDWGPSRTF